MKKVSTCLVVCLAGLMLVVLLHTITVILTKSGSYSHSVILDTKSSSYYLSKASKAPEVEDDECRAYYQSIDKESFPEDKRILDKRAMEIAEVPSSINHLFTPLGQDDINSVKKFVFFIGYARSGHSIVGSLLDAHPNIAIAHEFNLFREWTGKEGKRLTNRSYLYNKLWANSHNSALKGWRSKQKSQKGYNLNIDFPWQGRFDKLLVIGDKSGATTTRVYLHSPGEFTKLLDSLKTTVDVPIKVVHVIRNPYDITSTRVLYVAAAAQGMKSKLDATADHKYCDILELRIQVNKTIALMSQVNKFLTTTDLDVLNVHLVDLIEDPSQTMKELCIFLGVDCPQDYISACTRKLYKDVPKTRNTVVWPEWLVNKVYSEIIRPFSSFSRYSFSSA